MNAFNPVMLLWFWGFEKKISSDGPIKAQQKKVRRKDNKAVGLIVHMNQKQPVLSPGA